MVQLGLLLVVRPASGRVNPGFRPKAIDGISAVSGMWNCRPKSFDDLHKIMASAGFEIYRADLPGEAPVDDEHTAATTPLRAQAE